MTPNFDRYFQISSMASFTYGYVFVTYAAPDLTGAAVRWKQ